MPARQTTETPLAPELEAIATAAADRVRSQADATADDGEPQRRVAEAASAAIAAGAALGAIAAAEQVGQARARGESRPNRPAARSAAIPTGGARCGFRSTTC
jgi:hypothetical protein